MLTICLAAILTACGTDAAGSAAPSASPAPSTTAAPSPSPEPTPSAPATASPAADAAPPELAGRWRRSIGSETVILTLQGSGYHIQRGSESGSGRISVDGDRIEFYGSNRCDARGIYTWAIEEERLRLTMGEPVDVCGRTEVLVPGTFGRVEE